MDKKGKLIIISGFSGVGKGTVIARLMEKYEGQFAFSVSATTRYRREHEVHGKDYFFISREQFKKGIAGERFLEHAQYSGNHYGTPADYVFSQMEQGVNIILDIEFQGAFQVKERCPEALMIFLIPASAEVLVNRLVNRGTETREQVQTRLTQALTEADKASRYDAIVINDKLEQTVVEIVSLVNEPQRMQEFYDKNVKLISTIKNDLQEILKTW